MVCYISTNFIQDEEANMFDTMPSQVQVVSSEDNDELARYLAEDVDLSVKDPLKWWRKRAHMYPHLSRMALDYLSIPGKLAFCFLFLGSDMLYDLATSVDVERVFSRGRILISHLRNRLSAQTTRSLLCLQVWSQLGYVEESDLLAAARQEPVKGSTDIVLEDGWDRINV